MRGYRKNPAIHLLMAFFLAGLILASPPVCSLAFPQDPPDGGALQQPPTELAQFKADLGFLILGIVFLAMGLVTLSLTFLRSASRDPSIYLFGIMSCIWGTRFLLDTDLVPLLLRGNPHLLARSARAFTYLAGAAAFSFAWAYLGPGWKKSLRGLALASLTFFCAGSVVLLMNPDPDVLLPVFNVMVILGAMLIIVNLLGPDLRRQDFLPSLLLGLVVSVILFALENFRALKIIPIPFSVEWIGVLVLYLTLGQLIAVRLFTNERRLVSINQELATARKIQTSLLPEQVPRMSGIDLAVRYLPMNEVAGDFYDFIMVDEKRLGILIADVAGHGVPGALIATLVKGAFRAQVEHICRPEMVLEGMNRILTGQLGSMYVTASCTYFDLAGGFMRYAGAGHPPLLIRPKGGDGCSTVHENGLLLGQFPEARYKSLERSVRTGERFLIYTDGLIAAVSDWTRPTLDKSLEDDLTAVVIDLTEATCQRRDC